MMNRSVAEEHNTQELFLASSLMVLEGTATTNPPEGFLVTLVGLGTDGLGLKVEKRPGDNSRRCSESSPETFTVQRISMDPKYTWKTYYAGKHGEELVLKHDVPAPWPDAQPDPLPWRLRYKGGNYHTVGKVQWSPLLQTTDTSLTLSVVISREVMMGGMERHDLSSYFYPLVIDKHTATVEHVPPHFSRMNASCTVRADICTEHVMSIIQLLDSTLEIRVHDRVGYMKKLRSIPGTLSKEEIGRMIRERNFRDTNWGDNPKGDFPNEYEIQTLQGDKVVIDYTSGLMWQQSESSKQWSLEQGVDDYTNELNNKRYAGYSDWRLPTIEELASLIEPTETQGYYIDPIFALGDSMYMSSDKVTSDESLRWGVSFGSGYVIPGPGRIRAVRTQPWGIVR
jgi:Protein of unknown function (DUF1566)